MTYRPAHVPQLDGTRYAGLNCVAATAAMLLDRQTLGAKTASGADIRGFSGDRVGGITFDQAHDALLRGYGEQTIVRNADDFDRFLDRIGQGYGACMAGEYYIIPRDLSCQPSFREGHAFYLNELDPTGTRFYGYDPLCRGPKWYSVSLIRRYAGAHIVGLGRIRAIYTERPVGVDMVGIGPGLGSDYNLGLGELTRTIQYGFAAVILLAGLWLFVKGMPRRVEIATEGVA